MASRLALVVLAAFLLAGPAAADTIYEQKQSVDDRIGALQEKVAATRAREAAIRADLAEVTGQIQTLSQQVGDVSRHLAPLEHELVLRERKLNRLNALYQVLSQRLVYLREQYAQALGRLNQRLVALYESEQTDGIAIVLASGSFRDLLDAIDYARTISEQDKRIADEVGETKRQVRIARQRTRRLRDDVHQQARLIAVRVAQAREARDRLAASKAELEGAQARRRERLSDLSESEQDALGEMNALQKVSGELAARIRAAQAASAGSSGPADTTPSAAGLVWPVNGPVTSPFGWRWGRIHEGIDIAAPSGTPIQAAAAGRVIVASWIEGYGNLIVLDHGGGLATAYAHQSGFAVGLGQDVAQGQVIGYVGCTGHCFGPHLHFEVRVNGAAVDPLGYL
jgi:murein DD-endopeptidase MepM/ murein hydrolase activator NlpD